jgi:hypothetical protein
MYWFPGLYNFVNVELIVPSFFSSHENADQLLLIGYISTFDKDVSPIQVLIFSYFPDFWRKKNQYAGQT